MNWVKNQAKSIKKSVIRMVHKSSDELDVRSSSEDERREFGVRVNKLHQRARDVSSLVVERLHGQVSEEESSGGATSKGAATQPPGVPLSFWLKHLAQEVSFIESRLANVESLLPPMPSLQVTAQERSTWEREKNQRFNDIRDFDQKRRCQQQHNQSELGRQEALVSRLFSDVDKLQIEIQNREADSRGTILHRFSARLELIAKALPDLGAVIADSGLRTTNEYELIWSRRPKNGGTSFAVWRPVAPAGYGIFGDVVVVGGGVTDAGNSDIDVKEPPKFATVVVSMNHPHVRRASDYRRLWTTERNEQDEEDGTLFYILPQAGFRSFGIVAMRGNCNSGDCKAALGLANVLCFEDTFVQNGSPTERVWDNRDRDETIPLVLYQVSNVFRTFLLRTYYEAPPTSSACNAVGVLDLIE